MAHVVNQCWILLIFLNLDHATSRQLDVIMGLDVSKNTDELGFNSQQEFFKTLTENIYVYNETSIRVGFFAYNDRIRLHPQTQLWPNQNTSEAEVVDAIDTLNYTKENANPYLDHALRFALASFDADIARNKPRECSEKILMMVVTDQVNKWSNGRREAARLQEIGVKLLFVHVGDKISEPIEAGEKLTVSNYRELNSSNNVGNASHFLTTILTEGLGSCCSSTVAGGHLKNPSCAVRMGNKCYVSCDRLLNSPRVVLATCENNGVWSTGGEKVCGGFELHVLSLAIGGISVLVVACIGVVLCLCRKKRKSSKKITTPVVMQFSTQRSVRNQYSNATSSVKSSGNEESEANDGEAEVGMVYDYAQEESIIALSKRSAKVAMQEPKETREMQFLRETANGIHFNTLYEDQEIYENSESNCHVLSMSANPNLPPPCEGYGDSQYVECEDQDVYLNDEHEIYINTAF